MVSKKWRFHSQTIIWWNYHRNRKCRYCKVPSHSSAAAALLRTTFTVLQCHFLNMSMHEGELASEDCLYACVFILGYICPFYSVRSANCPLSVVSDFVDVWLASFCLCVCVCVPVWVWACTLSVYLLLLACMLVHVHYSSFSKLVQLQQSSSECVSVSVCVSVCVFPDASDDKVYPSDS